MISEDMSPAAIAEDLGHRLKRARLNIDLTQAELAIRTGLNRRTILNAEKGKAQLENFVAILVPRPISFDQIFGNLSFRTPSCIEPVYVVLFTLTAQDGGKIGHAWWNRRFNME